MGTTNNENQQTTSISNLENITSQNQTPNCNVNNQNNISMLKGQTQTQQNQHNQNHYPQNQYNQNQYQQFRAVVLKLF